MRRRPFESKSLFLIATCALVSAACGHKSGPQPGDITFWQATDSNVEFSGCSDDPDFRSQVTPPDVDGSMYLVYRVSSDGKTAIQQDCSALDATTCADSNPPITFTITGNQLFGTDTVTDMVTGSTCEVQEDTNSTLTDNDKTATFESDDVLSLVNDPAACMQVDDGYKQNSPNGLGLQGCLVKWTVNFTKR